VSRALTTASGSQDVPGQLSFGGRNASAASIEVLANPDPQAGNTLATPDAVVPSRHAARLQGCFQLPGAGQLADRG